ncbi:porin [Bartonella refiksaydamii]|uniref:porin n=1 Tax=Bartonella refiksaydamii TaxID=2654951 RepID=UPI0012ECA022|nr:porin [Bartonella refiksaydamii]
MNTKCLITASIFALISASATKAADVMVPHQPTTATSTAFVAPTFTWSGFYLGGQVGGFLSKPDMSGIDKDKIIPLHKDLSFKLSGFEGGFYAGSNIDLGDSFVFGIDTDLIWSGQKQTKTITIGASGNAVVDNLIARSRRSASTTPPTTPPTTPVSTNSTPAAKSTQTSTISTVKTPSAPSGGSSTTQTAPATEATQRSPALSTTGTSATSKPAAEKPAASVRASSSETRRNTSSERSAQGVSSTQTSSARSEAPVQSSAPTKTVAAQASSINGAGVGAHGQSSAHHGAGYGAGKNSHGSGNPHGSAANPHGASSHSSNPHSSKPHGEQKVAGHGAQSAQAADESATNVYGIEQVKNEIAALGNAALGLEQGSEVETLSHTLKQNWAGATRVRIGFAADRFMPYIAGGVAYTQLQDTISISFKKGDGKVVSSKDLADETKTMIGYTIGGGVDFAMLDNVIVRAEYRYSDFGKKKFANERLEIRYKTNDFRVGVAYKF